MRCPSSWTRPSSSPRKSLARSAAHRAARNEPLPPPLPPAERTVGQVVAESVRLYGRRFWAVLPLGLVPAGLDQVLHAQGLGTETVVLLTVGSVALTVAYERAAVIVLDATPTRRQLLVGLAAGVVAFLPVPILVRLYILPSLAWLALVGLCVPVVLVEGAGFSESFRRAFRLARADYVHVLGSLATLVIVYFLSRTVLVLLLQGQGDQTERIALFLGDLAISPLLFVGGALLYVDQSARLVVNSARQRAEEA